MDTTTLLPLAIAIFLYALVSRRAFGTLVSAPLAFTTLGLLSGELGVGWIELDVSSSALNTLAEITLVLALFSDASTIDITRLGRQHAIPVRLLGIGLPVTILTGLAVAMWLLPELSLIEATLLAIVLAPTDAALGQAVVSNTSVPTGIRRALNVESGLNDGLAFPALLVVASFAIADTDIEGIRSLTGWAGFVFSQLVFGPMAGLAIGWMSASLVNRAVAGNSISPGFLRLSTVALATAAYGTAEWIGGNGFLSAFVCGLTVGAMSHPLRTEVEDFAQAEGQLLALFVFFALGAVLLPATLASMEWRHVLYALLSLTVIRMLPVALSLSRQKLDRKSILFLGWFGPRGLASIIYLLLLTDDYALDAIDQIGAVVLLTVVLSIVLHGVTATPLARRYAKSRGNEPATTDLD